MLDCKFLTLPRAAQLQNIVIFKIYILSGTCIYMKQAGNMIITA